MPFLETPLYSHYHLFLRSFHARPWKSFRDPSPPPSREISSLGDIAPPLPPPREKFKRGGNLRDSLPSPPSSWNKRRKADRKFPSLWIKVFSKLLSPPPPSPFLSSYLLLSVQVATAGLRGNGRGNFGAMFSIYLSWCWTYQGASFRDEILFNCKINRGEEISGINSTGYWLCENAW